MKSLNGGPSETYAGRADGKASREESAESLPRYIAKSALIFSDRSAHLSIRAAR
jgi:hypothetical protein